MTGTDSPYFKVISPNDVGHKVAPGMDKVFMVQFTADQKKVFKLMQLLKCFMYWRTALCEVFFKAGWPQLKAHSQSLSLA